MSENNKEVKPFNANDVMQSVKDKIKASFVGLIPDEQWEAMVKKEIDEFINPQKNNNSWNNNYYPSGFSKIAKELLDNYAREKISEMLRKDEVLNNALGDDGKLRKEYMELIANSIPNLFVNLLTNSMVDIANNTYRNLQNSRGY